jgi:hypothetical protein
MTLSQKDLMLKEAEDKIKYYEEETSKIRLELYQAHQTQPPYTTIIDKPQEIYEEMIIKLGTAYSQAKRIKAMKTEG